MLPGFHWLHEVCHFLTALLVGPQIAQRTLLCGTRAGSFGR